MVNNGGNALLETTRFKITIYIIKFGQMVKQTPVFNPLYLT